MEQFPQAMQKYLMKMEQKYGKLKHLTSRATEETSYIINEIIETAMSIFKKYNMFLKQKSLIIDYKDRTCCIAPNVINGYNWLLLNTHFQLQNFLAEDVRYGFMVGQWPALAPYLFVQIVWHFQYEIILVESFAHIPLELCIEILEIIIKCMHELERERARDLIIRLTGDIYKRCLRLHRPQASEKNLKECAWKLVAHFQILLDLLTNSKITRFLELPAETRYQEHGILIKILLCHIKKCISIQEIVDKDCNTKSLFTLVCNTCHNTLPVDDMKVIIKTLQQDLITLLLDQIKQVNFNEYLYWAEIDDMDNVMISLQRTIAIECQDFIQFMKQDIFPKNNDHLQQCLQQFAGDSESNLTFQELYHCITSGKPEGLKKLMKRYKEWDESVLNFIEQNIDLLMTEDYSILLEYVHHVFMYKLPKPKLIQIHQFLLKILTRLNIQTLYRIISQYLVRHLHDNSLVSLYENKSFVEFMEYNESIREPERHRLLLISLLFNAKAVLLTLIKIVIGDKQYSHIIFTARDMLLLRPFMCINMNHKHNILISCLRKISMTNLMWDSKKFINFVNFLLANQVLYADQLINDIYIPYLINAPFIYNNLMCILLCIRDILKKELCSYRTNFTLLLIGLIKRASSIRKCKLEFTTNTVNQVINNINKILVILFRMSTLNIHQQRIIINAIELVEPIDRAKLTPLFYLQNESTMEIIQDYERRCFAIHAQLCIDTQDNISRRELVHSIKLDRKALIRHMILHATYNEYIYFMHEMTLINWFYFGWTNEKNAFENIMSITIETIKLSIIYESNIFPKDKFIVLLLALVIFCESIAIIFKDLKYVINLLLLNLATLCDTISCTPYGKMFEHMLSHIQENLMQIINKDIEKCFKDINKWIEIYLINCKPVMDSIKNIPISSDIQDMYIAYSFVCACIEVFSIQKHFSIDDIWNSICKILKYDEEKKCLRVF